jgi:hypothetical protein
VESPHGERLSDVGLLGGRSVPVMLSVNGPGPPTMSGVVENCVDGSELKFWLVIIMLSAIAGLLAIRHAIVIAYLDFDFIAVSPS